MANPTRAAHIVAYLPTLYYQDPVLRVVVDAVAGRLADAQCDLEEVMRAHWTNTADGTPATTSPHLADLPRIGALVSLPPFPDEETTQRTPETIGINEGTEVVGPGDASLKLDQLLVGQQLHVGGTRQDDGTSLATRINVGRPLPVDGYEVSLSGLLGELTLPTPVDPVGRLRLLTGRSGVEMYRQRLKLTVEALLEGAGTASALLEMVAATMGWGPLLGTFADWSAGWTPSEPLFEARAAEGPGPIRLRELPLRPAQGPVPHAVNAGGRWTEINNSPLVVAPWARLTALDQPVVTPTLVSLDAQVAIATQVILEPVKFEDGGFVKQDVILRLDTQTDGTLRGTLTERRLPSGEAETRDVTDRLRIRTAGLQLDREGESAYLSGGTENQAAGLTLAGALRVLRLVARGEGVWGNAIQATAAADDGVTLRYDPAQAVDSATSGDVYEETLPLADLLAGESRLVTAHDLTFTLPEGESHWLYFDHMGWGIFDQSRWDQVVFDAPPAGAEEAGAELEGYPAKGFFDYADFDGAIFAPEVVRAYRFDQPDAVYDTARFSGTPEQVELLLGWQEGRRATIRIDVPLASERDRERLAFLPDMIRKVKAAGIKVVLASRFLETQPLGETPPVVHVEERTRESQPLSDAPAAHLRVATSDFQTLGERVIGVFDMGHWDNSVFDTG